MKNYKYSVVSVDVVETPNGWLNKTSGKVHRTAKLSFGAMKRNMKRIDGEDFTVTNVNWVSSSLRSAAIVKSIGNRIVRKQTE
jgi:hypothetical protein